MEKFKKLNVYPCEEDFGGDEYEYRLLLNGKEVARYGDDYHDKGSYKIDGFIDGYCFAKGIDRDTVEVTAENFADENVI